MTKESIIFTTDEGEEVRFFVEEETRINGTSYLLVSDSDDEESEAYILKDMSGDGDDVAEYVMVDDETEFEAIADVFRKMIDDADII